MSGPGIGVVAAGAGDDLAGGVISEAQRLVIAGPGEVVGEATERDGWEKVVLRVRGEVVKFVSYLNLTISYWRGEEELTGAEGGGDAWLD